jgi:ethanolamine ammonia-lyase large subunit
LNAFSFGVGDVLIGTNPVDGTPASIARVEAALRNIVQTFKLQDALPWCVLGHIDEQAIAAATDPSLVPVMFQSLAGTDTCLRTFGLTVDGLRQYARSGQPGFYFETGQGADFTNGGAHGVDMVVLEAMKYGLARGLRADMTASLQREPWLIVNDVAGFIGVLLWARERERIDFWRMLTGASRTGGIPHA